CLQHHRRHELVEGCRRRHANRQRQQTFCPHSQRGRRLRPIRSHRHLVYLHQRRQRHDVGESAHQQRPRHHHLRRRRQFHRHSHLRLIQCSRSHLRNLRLLPQRKPHPHRRQQNLQRLHEHLPRPRRPQPQPRRRSHQQ